MKKKDKIKELKEEIIVLGNNAMKYGEFEKTAKAISDFRTSIKDFEISVLKLELNNLKIDIKKEKDNKETKQTIKFDLNIEKENGEGFTQEECDILWDRFVVFIEHQKMLFGGAIKLSD